ncbi:MAG: type II secretion system protein N [Pelagibaca sp.]
MGSLIWASAQTAWHVAGHTTVLPRDMSVPAASEGPATPTNIGAITALAPFGAPVSESAQGGQGTSAARLNIALRGVLLDSDPQRSRAFLHVDGGIGVYRLGDDVQSTKLVRIETETITLKSGADLVVVGFDGVETGPAASTDQIAEAAPEAANDPFARLSAALVAGQGSVDLRDAPPPETTDDYINLWRDRIARNPQAAMEAVGVESVENGYRIKADPNIGVTLAGLRAGDVITGLNGRSVGDLDRDRKLYDEVAAAGIARLEVIRDGQSLLLTFPLR